VPDWSIRILPVNSSHPAGPAEFEPQGERSGRPLEAWVGDTVTWNNTTDAAHWPWPTDANYQPLNVQLGDLGYMSDNIQAKQGSRPTFNVGTQPALLHYYCKNHPNEQSERGTINVIPIPSP
jgi:plastocyanin